MKFGLLVVLAVAVLAPSLSEGRTVSKCELKEKLGEAITLPRKLQKVKERILAIVICEVNRRSQLNTALTRVYGIRTTTTTAGPTVAVTTLSTAQANETDNEGMTARPPTNQTTTTTTTTTTPQPTTSQSALVSQQTAGGNRRRREAGAGKKGSVSAENLEELLNEQEGKFDEQELEEDDNNMGDEEEEDSNEEEGDSNSESEEGGKRQKRRASHRRHGKRKPWSLGFYGLFQLSDSHFCDSGYRWSRNLCRTSCTAFTDDDISDDISCFVRTNYWWFLVRSASRSCYYASSSFFSGC